MTTTRVYAKGGSFYYVEDLDARGPSGRPKQKWHKLTRVSEGEAAMHRALAVFIAKDEAKALGDLPARVTEFSRSRFGELSLGVKKEYERMFAVISTAFADFNVADVTPGDVLDFLDDNFSGKATTRRSYKARLSTFFSFCVQKSYLAVNPCREIKLREPAKRRGRMNAAVYWAMHDALPEAGRVFLELCYYTQQRPTEIRLLRESSVRDDRVRFEPTKTLESSAEYVEVARWPVLDRLLERARAVRTDTWKCAPHEADRKVIPLDERRDPFVLVSEDGRPFTKTGMNSMWRRARERAAKALPVLEAALLNVTTRDIRPFALSQMEAQGYALPQIRQAAAHTTTGQTEDYLNQHRERFSNVALQAPAKPAQ